MDQRAKVSQSIWHHQTRELGRSQQRGSLGAFDIDYSFGTSDEMDVNKQIESGHRLRAVFCCNKHEKELKRMFGATQRNRPGVVKATT